MVTGNLNMNFIWTMILWLLYRSIDEDRFWRGLLLQCTRACASRKSNSSVKRLRDWTQYPYRQSIVTTDRDRSVLITIITWHVQFHLANVSILHLKYVYGARSESRFACFTLYLPCHVVPLKNEHYRLQMPVIKGLCARDAQLHTYRRVQIRWK